MRRQGVATVVLVLMLDLFCAGAEAALECRPTAPDQLGPFYVPEAPFSANIAAPEEPGERVVISGRVLGSPDCAPLADAVVEVWQASASGQYYFPNAAGGTEPSRSLLRGRMRTDHEGSYRFETVLPAAYDLGGGASRPPHIHFRVTHPDYQPLVTQLYFADRPGAPLDPFGEDPRVIELSPGQGTQGATAPLQGEFNITLRPRTGPAP
jgi:protocatechuate 3,4-dioxygenase beta subunit